jgi:hypothetical protein
LKKTKKRRPAAEVQAERQAQADADADLQHRTTGNAQLIVAAQVHAMQRDALEQARMVKNISALDVIAGEMSADSDEDLMDVEPNVAPNVVQEPSSAVDRTARSTQPTDIEMSVGPLESNPVETVPEDPRPTAKAGGGKKSRAKNVEQPAAAVPAEDKLPKKVSHVAGVAKRADSYTRRGRRP